MSGTGSAAGTDQGAASTITNANKGSERPGSSRMGSARFQVLPPITSPVPEKPAGMAG